MRRTPSVVAARCYLLGWLLIAPTLLTAAAPDSPVAEAARRGDLEAIRSLLKQGADVNAAQGDGMTALHWAARRGDAEMAQILIYAGANLRAATRIGAYTPLLAASRYGHFRAIETLLDAGADVNAVTSTGATALHLAAASGRAEAITLLISRGADPNARESTAGQTPLMFAAARNRVDVVTALIQHGADAELTTSVVDIEARDQADKVARKLRSKRLAAIRAERDYVGSTDNASAGDSASTARARTPDPTAELQSRDVEPTDTAAMPTAETAREADEDSKADTVDTPVATNTGVRTDSADRAGEKDRPKPLTYAQLVGGHGGLTALLHAARQGHTEAVRALLEAGADVNQVSGGDETSPLLIATINGHFDLAKILLAHGADPNLASAAGATPLYGALNVQWAPHAFYPQPSTAQEETTHLQLLEALLTAGADPNARLTKKVWYTGYNFDQSGVDEAGATAFWRAAQSSDVEAMRLLTAHGADPTIWSKVVPERRRPGGENSDEDLDAPPPVPIGGPATSALHVATGAGYDGNYHRNAPSGWLPAVRFLVEELGFDVNEPDHKGYTALHNAAFRGDDAMIRYLVERGADVTAVARSGQTTVDMANGPIQRLQPFPETIALLESLGAKNNHKCVSC